MKFPHLAIFCVFLAGWIVTSTLGWLMNLQLVGAVAGIILGSLFARFHTYSDDEYVADLNNGFAHVMPEKRTSKAIWIAIYGMVFSATLIAIPFVVTMDEMQFGTPALGGITLPMALKFLLQSRRIGREGITR